MSCCDKIFNAAEESRKNLDAPTRIIPGCHPKKGKVEVYVDSQRDKIYLCCSICETVIDVVKTKWTKYGNITTANKRPKAKGKG